MFALRWSDIDMATGGVSITRSMADRKGEFKEKPVKTANGRRRVVLDFSRPALEDHRQQMAAEGQDVAAGFVFCTTEGGPLRKEWFSTHAFKPAKKAAKLPDLTFHGIRHGSATLALLAGVDTKIVSRRLGHHSSGFTANEYQHVLAGMQERAAGAPAC